MRSAAVKECPPEIADCGQLHRKIAAEKQRGSPQRERARKTAI
jgi:hypothetical protein